MKAVILVGGEGTRLRPITQGRPKPMAPIGNVPFLAHMLSHLKRHGIDDIVLAMGYLPGPIADYFGDGSQHGVTLTYEIESKPLGTAGAARNALRHLDSTCFVFNGDVFTTIDLTTVLAAHRRRGAEVTLTLTPVEDPSRFGVVVADAAGRVVRFIEKPPRDEAPTNLINAGIYVLEPQVLERVPIDSFYMFENGLFPTLLAEQRPFFAEAPSGYWVDIGTPEKYLEVNRDYAAGRIDSGVARSSPEGPCVGEGCAIDPQAVVSADSSIGAGARLGPGVTVQSAVVLPAAVLEAGVTVRDSVIGQAAVVGAGATISGESVIGDRCRIGAGSQLVATRVWQGLSLPAGTRREGATITAQEDVA